MSDVINEKRVLALKYRPKRFEDLVGQSTISQTLSLALDSNRLSHAYLFSGLRGSGKTSTARIMAKALLCENGPTSKPCEVCENCKSANSNRHLDIIEMDAASNRGIDDIKDLIEHTKYKPSSARFKVFIIDEVHMLTTQAFNALLKTLEEPPGFVKFILATTDPLKLPATILSRTQHFRFNKISNGDVVHHLAHILNEENIDYEIEALEILARSGHGSLRDTLTLLDQAIIFSKGKVNTIAVVDMLGLIEPKVMDKIFDIVLSKKDITSLVKELENYEISQVCDEMTIYLKQKMLEKDARYDLLMFDRFFRILGDAKHLLALNSDSSFVLILTLLKLQEATNLKTIQDIINQVEDIEVHPEIKDAVSTTKVIEHAKEDTNHLYDDTDLPIIKEEVKNIDNIEKTIHEVNEKQEPVNLEEKKEELLEEVSKVQESQNNTLSLDVIENSIPFANPFDEEFEESSVKEEIQEEKTKQEENLQEIKEEAEEITIHEEPNLHTYEDDNSTNDAVEEVLTSHIEEQKDEYEKKYETVINKVYDRDIRLGECFEDNFVYKSFNENTLQIISHAQGDERKFLFKHFGVLKTFIYDVFGASIELDFIKEEGQEQKKKSKNVEIKSPQNSNLEPLKEQESNTKLLQDELAGGSGCVASMHNTSAPTPAQQELQINDVLNSKMLNSAKELFDIKKITVKTKT